MEGVRVWRLAAVAALSVGCGRLGYDAVDGAPQVDANDIQTGLIARYSFDLGVTSDALGSHPATCVPACPSLADKGVRGAALDMSAGPEHLVVSDSGSSFKLASGFTISGWVRYRDYSARTCIFTKPVDVGGTNSWALCTEAGGTPFFYSCESCDFVRASQPVALDTWVHLAATYDGVTKSLFVDGALAGQVDGAITFDTSDLVIGGDDDLGNFGFATDGLLDELRVYNRPLTTVEVEILAAAPQ